MTSNPLFIRVDESMVIFAPMLHVGCASASAAVTPASCARVRPRKGPPDAVTHKRATSRASSPMRHW